MFCRKSAGTSLQRSYSPLQNAALFVLLPKMLLQFFPDHAFEHCLVWTARRYVERQPSGFEASLVDHCSSSPPALRSGRLFPVLIHNQQPSISIISRSEHVRSELRASSGWPAAYAEDLLQCLLLSIRRTFEGALRHADLLSPAALLRPPQLLPLHTMQLGNPFAFLSLAKP
jgi:hypothetical protein